MRASVVAGRDTSPVFQAAEHVLNAVPRAVERPVIRDRQLAAARGRDARRGAAFMHGIAEAAAVVTTIGDQLACCILANIREKGQHRRRQKPFCARDAMLMAGALFPATARVTLWA